MHAWVVNGALKDMMEHRFPLIPGVEASGVIQGVGGDVDAFREGDRVYGVSMKPFFGSGTFAERVTLTSDAIAAAPASVDMVEAAGLSHVGLTALAIADALHPGKGKTISLWALRAESAVI